MAITKWSTPDVMAITKWSIPDVMAITKWSIPVEAISASLSGP